MKPKILLLSTAVGILSTWLVFLIADLFFAARADDYPAAAIALFIGSCGHFLTRHLLSKSA